MGDVGYVRLASCTDGVKFGRLRHAKINFTATAAGWTQLMEHSQPHRRQRNVNDKNADRLS